MLAVQPEARAKTTKGKSLDVAHLARVFGGDTVEFDTFVVVEAHLLHNSLFNARAVAFVD